MRLWSHITELFQPPAMGATILVSVTMIRQCHVHGRCCVSWLPYIRPPRTNPAPIKRSTACRTREFCKPRFVGKFNLCRCCHLSDSSRASFTEEVAVRWNITKMSGGNREMRNSWVKPAHCPANWCNNNWRKFALKTSNYVS